jgi:hypothetical protein
MTTKPQLPENLLLAYADEIQAALGRAVRHALLMHKRAGNPIAVWRDGRVVIIPPEEIVVDDEPEPAQG